MWTRDDRKKVSEYIAALAVSFNRVADEAMFLGYFLGLDGLTVDQVQRATAKALRTCKFMPAPAELRELAGEISVKHRVALAWDAVKQAIGRHGAYRSVSFDDRCINAAVASLGGWPHVCGSSEVVLDRDLFPRFQRLYEAYLARGTITSAEASPLLGIFARENSLNGFDEPKVIEIDTGLGTKLAIASPEKKPALPHVSVARIGVIDA